jgi:hypothetical protein
MSQSALQDSHRARRPQALPAQDERAALRLFFWLGFAAFLALAGRVLLAVV